MSGTARASAASGFTATALVTPDRDWLRKWNRGSSGVALNSTGALSAGQHATLILLFQNAQVRAGRVSVLCQVTIRHTPANSGTNQSVPPTPCYNGPPPPRGNLALAGLQVALNTAPGGRPGIIRFDIVMTDANSGSRVPLTLQLRDNAGRR